MARWEAGARDRLRAAALHLFALHGFDGVTTARIAEEAGLTERTFFRYFADKREVLFTGQEEFDEVFLRGVRECSSPDVAALVDAALAGAVDFFPEERRAWSRSRQAVVAADPQLQERELLKLSTLAAALERAFAGRGVAPLSAAVAAQAVLSVFHVAFQQWIAAGEERSFAEVQASVRTALRVVAAG